MSYFCIIGHAQFPLVRVEILDKRFTKDKQGFYAVHTVHLETETEIDGARHTIAVLDNMFAASRKASGVYQTDLQSVVDAYEAILEGQDQPTPRPIQDRIAAGFAAGLLFLWITGAGTVFFVCWLVIIAVRQQSGLMAVAETAFIHTVLFGHRDLFVKLVEIALGRR